MIPLTTACLRALPLHTIRQLVAACPRRALTHPNGDGQLPLHAACSTMHQHTLETVLYLIHEYPYALQVADAHGNLPFHLAVRFASLPVIRAVWQAWPAAIQIRTITVSSSSSSSSPLLKRRTRKKGPTGGQYQNHQNQNPHQPKRLPFHLAMQERRDVSIISFLLSKFPAAVRMPDDDCAANTTTTIISVTLLPVIVGKLPLQLAIEQGVSMEIIQCLVNVDRGILSLSDSLGNLPLHCALQLSSSSSCANKSRSNIYSSNNNNSNSVYNRLVLYLLRQGPKNAAQVRNAAGDLPLHLACRLRGAGGVCSLSIIAALVRLYPGALRVGDALHGKLPLHWAILNNSDDNKENNHLNDNNNKKNDTLLDLIQLLVQQDSQTLQVQDLTDGCLALHFALHRHNTTTAAMTAAASANKASTTSQCCSCSLQLIDYLLDQYPQACRVANQCNGQLPLHMIADYASLSSSSSCFSNSNSSNSSNSSNQCQQEEQSQQQQHYYYSYNHSRQLLLLQLIHKIVQRYPQAIHMRDAKGCLPMTLACWSHAPLAILECLASSASLSSTCSGGGDAAGSSAPCRPSPLLFSCAHLLTSSSTSSLSPALSIKILQFILAQSPTNAISIPAAIAGRSHDEIPEYSGGLPLHVACAAGAPPAVIEYIIRQFESAVAIADGHGRLPLHCACNSVLSFAKKNAAAFAAVANHNNNNNRQTSDNNDNDMEMIMTDMEMTVLNSCNVMEYLLRIFPAAAAIVDHMGCLPLHHLAVAAAACASSSYSNNQNNHKGKMSAALLRIAKLLVKENAGALEHRNHEGYCPWLLAAIAPASDSKSHPHTTTTKVKETETGVGTADPCLDVLFYLAQQSPNSILPLAVAGRITSNIKKLAK